MNILKQHHHCCLPQQGRDGYPFQLLRMPLLLQFLPVLRSPWSVDATETLDSLSNGQCSCTRVNRMLRHCSAKGQQPQLGSLESQQQALWENSGSLTQCRFDCARLQSEVPPHCCSQGGGNGSP
ncbi:hypothetical protein cyc_01001 [Cyclospora cayetanensis]|uniref:Uncharacterized protein n=1 Tax=Cyclospora cayetanensis TaxID=88456 RepID=A0A1D3CWE3_9EIME|nr:hypothetical protein cyc_01001 [Cyclospora cayetanensis]